MLLKLGEYRYAQKKKRKLVRITNIFATVLVLRTLFKFIVAMELYMSVSDQNCSLLHDLIFRFVRKQRFVGLRFEVPADQVAAGLGHTEQSLLFVLDATPGSNVKELSDLIGLERSWMSRVVANLQKRGLLEVQVSDSDRRSKKIFLTTKGNDLLKESEQVVVEMFRENLASLSKNEQREFRDHLNKFADGLGAPDFEQHSGNDGIAYQLGRISAGFGMYGERMFGTDLTVSQLHTLLILQERRGKKSSLIDIDGELPMDTSTVSRIVQGFVKKGLVLKQQSERDRRSSHLELAANGAAYMNDYYKTVASVFKKALQSFSAKELGAFMALYEKVSRDIPYPVRGRSEQDTKLMEITGSEAQVKADSLLKKHGAVACGKQIGLFTGDTLTAVLSVDRNEKDGTVNALTIASKGLRNDELIDVIQSGLKIS